MKFHLVEINNGWKAWEGNNRRVWEFGITKEIAIYKLLITLELID